MNSQQELLNAINAISEGKDKSFDTPATVLRVEDDTVWVHIDGGADETPVRKTVSCEQGETVQVRISNGSAFLVGNASAPPTDDKVANVAHFVAEQADVKATSAEETAVRVSEEVSELEVEVDGKVDVGTSNITHMSSTMYQNANGVNIYNDTLSVGDSYAHIDGDSFDIKKATTAGTIDDVNDPVVASFGESGSLIKHEYDNASLWHYTEYIETSSSGIKIGESCQHGIATDDGGWELKREVIQTYGPYGNKIRIDGGSGMTISHPGNSIHSNIDISSVSVTKEADIYIENYSIMNDSDIEVGKINEDGYGDYLKTIIEGGDIRMTGDVYDYDSGYKKTPTVLTSTTISSSTTSYTFTNSAIKTTSVIDIYDTIFGFSPTAMSVSAGSCTVTFPAQSSSHTIKLFVY